MLRSETKKKRWILYENTSLTKGVYEIRSSELPNSAVQQSRQQERGISIGGEFYQVFLVVGAVAYLQVSPLGCSPDETWRGQVVRKRFVSWNLPKLSKFWRCNGSLQSTTRTYRQNNSWVGREIQTECAAKRTGQQGPSAETVERMRKLLSGAQCGQHIVWAGNCRCRRQVLGAFCANIFTRKDSGCGCCRRWITRITIFVSSSVWISNNG
jgi:hypothetical protein